MRVADQERAVHEVVNRIVDRNLAGGSQRLEAVLADTRMRLAAETVRIYRPTEDTRY